MVQIHLVPLSRTLFYLQVHTSHLVLGSPTTRHHSSVTSDKAHVIVSLLRQRRDLAIVGAWKLLNSLLLVLWEAVKASSNHQSYKTQHITSIRSYQELINSRLK